MPREVPATSSLVTDATEASSAARRRLGLAARGGLLLGLGQAAGNASTWIATLVLAHLLAPRDFGLVGMATVVLGFVATFNDLGLTAALVQRRDLDPAHRDAAFWTSLAGGAGLFAALALAAPAAARFYREPELTWILVGSASTLLLSPLSSTHASLLRRALRFADVARIELWRGVAAAFTSVTGAALGLGYWAIVLGPVAGHLVAIPAYRRAVPEFRPGFRGTRAHAKELFSFSLYVAGTASVNYLSANVDYVVVGRVLGPVVLGGYMLAYQLVTFPLTRISQLFNQVLFPAYSTLQDDLAAMREAYVGVSRSVALVTLPVVAWLAVVAPELVTLAYGARWLPAVPALRYLCVAGALKSVGTLVGPVFKARGKPHVEFYWNVVWALAVGLGVSAGVRWGIEGVAIAISLLCIPGVLVTERLACGYLELPLGRLLRALALPAAAALVAAATAFGARTALERALPGGGADLVLRLGALTALVLAVYAATLGGVHPGIRREIGAFTVYFRRAA